MRTENLAQQGRRSILLTKFVTLETDIIIKTSLRKTKKTFPDEKPLEDENSPSLTLLFEQDSENLLLIFIL